MLSQEALEHVSWEAGNALFPSFLSGFVSLMVLGPIEGTMSVGSNVRCLALWRLFLQLLEK